MFEPEAFVEACRAAIAEDPSHKAVLELTRQAFHDPSEVLRGVGEPTAGGIVPLYTSDTLTVLNVIWKPGMFLMPHNHNMWAIIGVYGGREDNIFWKRVKDDPTGRVEAAGAAALSTGDVTPLGKDIIHSVHNPTSKMTGALHIYGGNFFEIDRSEWDAETLTERPYDIERAKAAFKS